MNELKTIAIASNEKKASTKILINKIKRQTNKQLKHWIMFDGKKEKNENDFKSFIQCKFENIIKQDKTKYKTNSILKYEKMNKKTLNDFNGVGVFAKKSIIYSNSINQKGLNENQLKAFEILYDILHIIQNGNGKQYIDFYGLTQTGIKNDINDKTSVGKLGKKMQLKENIAYENAINCIINQLIEGKFKNKSININKLKQSMIKYIENKKDYQTIENDFENGLTIENDFENFVNASVILENINKNNNGKIDKILSIQNDIDKLKKDYKLKIDKKENYKQYQKKLNGLLQKIRIIKKSINFELYK